jgi:hypothetical protein
LVRTDNESCNSELSFFFFFLYFKILKNSYHHIGVIWPPSVSAKHMQLLICPFSETLVCNNAVLRRNYDEFSCRQK